MNKSKKKKRLPQLEKKSQTDELRYHGQHSCASLWQRRREAIIRVYLTKARLKEFADLLKWCAAQKKAYHVVEDEDLESISGSVHHEGICILARAPTRLDEKSLLAVLDEQMDGKPKECCLIYLDGVQNPHNIGSIMRVAAHFGVQAIIGKAAQLPNMTGAALRVAEGGAELVPLAVVKEPASFFLALQKRGFSIATTSSHTGTSLYRLQLPSKILFVLGAEVQGVSEQLSKKATLAVAIPGTGQVESLNVAMATALLVAEHWRQTHIGNQSHG